MQALIIYSNFCVLSLPTSYKLTYFENINSLTFLGLSNNKTSNLISEIQAIAISFWLINESWFSWNIFFEIIQ